MKKIQLEAIAFYFVLAILLCPMFFIDFWVTGDAPCHLYNSKIIADWQLHGEKDFYNPFLFFNEQIEPNWITNLIQIPLLELLPVGWADKAFFLLYFLTFCFGFRRLVLLINPNSGFVAVIGSIFAAHHLLMMGFTNNSWSIAIWFWVLAFWIQFFEKRTLQHCLGMAGGFLLLFLSHPVGFAFGVFSIACVVFGFGIFTKKEEGFAGIFGFWREQAIKLLLTSLPGLILFFHFLWRRGAGGGGNSTTIPIKDIWEDLSELKILINFSSRERDIVQALAILIGLLFVAAIFLRVKKQRFSKMDGLLLLFGASVWLLFNAPTSLAGGLEIGMRLGLITYLCLLFWIAITDFPKIFGQISSVAAVVIPACLLQVRLPIQIEASKLAAEVMSASDHIREKSTLLALNYDWNGQTPEGKQIANRIWLFGHIDCYLGAKKPLIISDNYELHMWYFPLIERSERNMYKHTTIDGMNFDQRPPRADILNYRQRTGGPCDIDYVLLISYRDEFAEHEYTKEIFEQLGKGYRQIFKSEFGRAILFERNQQGN